MVVALKIDQLTGSSENICLKVAPGAAGLPVAAKPTQEPALAKRVVAANAHLILPDAKVGGILLVALQAARGPHQQVAYRRISCPGLPPAGQKGSTLYFQLAFVAQLWGYRKHGRVHGAAAQGQSQTATDEAHIRKHSRIHFQEAKYRVESIILFS
ncbi:hypothetical protein GCM10022406_24520 [Hymenobacter algoricola]|uniref:Uncharacterized protein n=1 Tax=Hymenobacter algoricola TaxID=486267 RepID=A0ABP7N8A7_9BACT